MIALIAAKGNSERVPNKNWKPFADTTLIELKVKQLIDSHAFSEVLVSSEDVRVLDLAVKAGAIASRRDAALSKPDVPMSEVYQRLADQMFGRMKTEQNKDFAWIQCNNPLVGPEVYRQAVDTWRLLSGAYDTLLSVHRVHEYLLTPEGMLNFTRTPWPRSQDLDPLYALNFAVCITSAVRMYDEQTLVGSSPYLMEISREDAIDIDWPEEFDFCEAVYKKRKGL